MVTGAKEISCWVSQNRDAEIGAKEKKQKVSEEEEEEEEEGRSGESTSLTGHVQNQEVVTSLSCY